MSTASSAPNELPLTWVLLLGWFTVGLRAILGPWAHAPDAPPSHAAAAARAESRSPNPDRRMDFLSESSQPRETCVNAMASGSSRGAATKWRAPCACRD